MKVVMLRLIIAVDTPKSCASWFIAGKYMLAETGERNVTNEARVIVHNFFRSEKVVYGPERLVAADFGSILQRVGECCSVTELSGCSGS